ncbi:hypothetical protein J4Q44_G00182930 [Coregonus suidteri]|uniref:Equilibrative nucleoside transporter 4 n=1 Tax=Coregonus suidteri TaxID=861788 RepID=A0AAN8LMD6_9TELE
MGYQGEGNGVVATTSPSDDVTDEFTGGTYVRFGISKDKIRRSWPGLRDMFLHRYIVARVIWAYMLSIAVTYSITLCLFPGLESEIRNPTLGEWLPILIMATFNMADFVGKILAALPYEWTGGHLLLFSCLRVVFIPLMVMCVYPPSAPPLSHPAWPCVFSLLMGVTNGYFGSVPMIQAAGKVPPEQRELAGNTMTVSYMTGLMLGSAVAYAAYSFTAPGSHTHTLTNITTTGLQITQSNGSALGLTRCRPRRLRPSPRRSLPKPLPPPPGLPPGPTHPAHREPIREQRVSAPTYVPSVEVYDERVGPIQIASQARDKQDKLMERERDRESGVSRFPGRTLLDPRASLPGDLSNQREREEGSVIRSNGSALKRDGYVSQSGFSPDPRDTPKHAIRLGEGPRWNPISPLANYATSHMTALASQHGHTRSQHAHTQPSHNQHGLNRPPSDPHAPQRGHTRSPHPLPQPQRGEDGQRRYVDASALYRPGGGRGSSGGGGAES